MKSLGLILIFSVTRVSSYAGIPNVKSQAQRNYFLNREPSRFPEDSPDAPEYPQPGDEESSFSGKELRSDVDKNSVSISAIEEDPSPRSWKFAEPFAGAPKSALTPKIAKKVGTSSGFFPSFFQPPAINNSSGSEVEEQTTLVQKLFRGIHYVLDWILPIFRTLNPEYLLRRMFGHKYHMAKTLVYTPVVGVFKFLIRKIVLPVMYFFRRYMPSTGILVNMQDLNIESFKVLVDKIL